MTDPSPQPTAGTSRRSVAIIGGGFTGLTAARRLALTGHDVTVYEAGSEVGGLAASTEIAGIHLEKAYHFVYKTDEHTFALLDELGIRDQLEFHLNSSCTVIDNVVYPMSTPLDLLKFSPLKFHNRVRAGVSALYLQFVKDWDKLTEITAIDWLNKYAGKEVTSVVWEPLLRGKFDQYYDQVTMAWLWGRFKQRADSRSKGEAYERLGYLNDGFDSITDALVRDIEASGGSLRLNTRIDRIVEVNGRPHVSIAESSEAHDAVLMTVPSHVAGKLIETARDDAPDYFDQLEAVDYLDAAILLFVTDKPISSYYWHNMNNPDAAFVAFLGLSALVGTENTGGKYVYYAGDYIPPEHEYMSMTEDELRDRWFAELRKVWPLFSPDDVIDSKVYRFRNAQHVVDIGFEEKLADHQTPMPGVFLANFSQIFPMDRGTNYAIRDGEKLAAQIASSF